MDSLGIATGSTEAAAGSLLQKVVDRLFRCAHRNRTRPFTPRGEDQSYAVCLDCGKRLPCERPLMQPEPAVKAAGLSAETFEPRKEIVPDAIAQKTNLGAPARREEVKPEPPKKDSPTPATSLGLASWKYEFLWIGLFVVGLSGGLYWAPNMRPAHKAINRPLPAKPLISAAVVRPSLGLSVERRGSELLLSWDHDSEAIRTATKGTIFVRAGDAGWEIPLSGDQLHSRRAVATPTAKEVDLRLQVVNDAQVVTEDSILVSSPKTHSEAAVPVPAVSPAAKSVPVQPQAARQDVPAPSAGIAPQVQSPRLEGKDSVVVLGRDADAALELSRHPDRLKRLIESGSLFTVARGTAITVLQKQRRIVKVHVAEGSMAGLEGWAQASEVTSHQNPAEPAAEKQLTF